MTAKNNLHKRGEIWWVILDPTMGVETKKTRPCLILQNDVGNKRSRLTTIAPLLAPRNMKIVVNIQPTSINGLDKTRGLHLNQVRAIDSTRVKSKLGEIESSYWDKIREAILVQLGFDC